MQKQLAMLCAVHGMAQDPLPSCKRADRHVQALSRQYSPTCLGFVTKAELQQSPTSMPFVTVVQFTTFCVYDHLHMSRYRNAVHCAKVMIQIPTWGRCKDQQRLCQKNELPQSPQVRQQSTERGVHVHLNTCSLSPFHVHFHTGLQKLLPTASAAIVMLGYCDTCCAMEALQTEH